MYIPPEIWQNIFSHLSPRTWGLYSMVCRDWRDIIYMHRLYWHLRTVYTTKRNSKEWENYMEILGSRPRSEFICTVPNISENDLVFMCRGAIQSRVMKNLIDVGGFTSLNKFILRAAIQLKNWELVNQYIPLVGIGLQEISESVKSLDNEMFHYLVRYKEMDYVSCKNVALVALERNNSEILHWCLAHATQKQTLICTLLTEACAHNHKNNYPTLESTLTRSPLQLWETMILGSVKLDEPYQHGFDVLEYMLIKFKPMQQKNILRKLLETSCQKRIFTLFVFASQQLSKVREKIDWVALRKIIPSLRPINSRQLRDERLIQTTCAHRIAHKCNSYFPEVCCEKIELVVP